ncbi:carboxypeptidase-like regulatory domain-containing protein [Flavobacterium sp. 20NA77.7]|uniref:Carboxypeptidase-like regulatory domain-containing protein n=1 Tax=Flavobacterium nakdongensis TaxID=3073563 RepID=A0ABY9RAU6_9FLAO|nr:TonB-dependent receptor [Flavobacterium sp. 20NA77.7]WMW77914.1 carboxypeptidase-like regulatory domain-containing protein [Flavobacterium sp. 20NA77.7]
MKKINFLFFALVMMFSSMAIAQTTVTGTVVDDANKPLASATVKVKGSSISVLTSENGSFKITSKESKGTLVVSFIGFDAKEYAFSGSQDLGSISLQSNTSSIEEVVVKTTTIDVAKNRKTPVAVSTIKASVIAEKLGNQEFPEILNNTPSAYATKSGGGFGDSRVNIRGFNQNNIAVLINGVPVNDMENSSVYWSNWAGLSDVTSAMQVQRGLGSSKLAISSVGGTINVVTKSADQKQGGNIGVTIGNNDYLKAQYSYNTGKMKNGLSASVLFSSTTGNGYVDGTKFEGYNYFVGLGYEINKKHDLQFIITGAPQWHNQRSAAPTIAQYIQYGVNGEPNIKYNSDWGRLNGEEYSFRTNFYHKPVMSLNWDWKISDKMKLSTVFYGSWGRGGGSNGTGAIRGNQYNNANLRLPDGTINVDFIQAWNQGQAVTNGTFAPAPRATIGGYYENSSSTSNTATNGISKISSINSHNWYGGIMNLNTKLTDKFTLDFGVDMRTYRGIHYQVLNDLLGSTFYRNGSGVSTGDINNPNEIVTWTYNTTPNGNPFFNTNYQKAINYNNDGLVRWFGAFTQLEYATEKLTAFVQGAVSQQGFKKNDYFLYLTSNPLSSTSYKNIMGGNIKGGVNYNINEQHNVFVNTGYYSKQPFFNAVYPNNKSLVNENLTNEKIFGLEAGYGFKSATFNANVNIYHTTWKDRYQRSTDAAPTNQGGYFDFAGIQEVHDGVELEFTYKPLKKLDINGMFSYGNWYYKNDITANRYDVNNAQIGTGSTLYLDGVKVGDAAQTTAALGAAYKVTNGLKIDANYRYADRLYAAISPANFTTANNKGSLQLPSFGLLDAGVSYKMELGKNKSESLNFRFNMNNVLDKVYIAESKTNIFADDNVSSTNPSLGTYASNNRLYNGVANANQVFFGFGRTWNLSVAYKF